MRTSVLALLALAVGSAATTVPAKAAVVAAPSVNSTTSVCGWGSYDFSSLTTTDLSGTDGSTDTYYLHLCGVLQFQSGGGYCTSSVPNAAVCAVQPVAGTYAATDLGDWSGSANWSFMDESNQGLGVQYSMQTAAASCWSSGSPQPYVANVQLACAATQGVMTVSSANGCTQNFTVPTPLACNGPPQPAPACGFEQFDFSSLTNTDLVGTDGFSMNTYYLRVCGALQTQPAAYCTKNVTASSACSVQPVAGTYSGTDLGEWSGAANAQWGFIDVSEPSLGVQYTMQTAASSCWSSGSPQPHVTNVQFTCAQTQQLKVDLEINECNQAFVVYTPLACVKSLKDGERVAIM